MPPPKKHKADHPFHYEGEGTALGVVIQGVTADEGGVYRARSAVDLKSAPAPSRKFIADAFEVRDEFTQCRILFAQRKLDGKSIRAILDIRFPVEPLVGAMKSLGAIPLPPDFGENDLFKQVFSEEPEQTVAVEANFLRANGGPTATTLDFYYSSAFSLSRMVAEKVVYAEGVARILIPGAMIYPLREELVKIFGHLLKKDSNGTP